LIVYLPPFQSNGAPPPPLPRPLQEHPVAVINYRWAGSTPLPLPAIAAGAAGTEDEGPAATTRWPTPIHDTLFGYSWLVEHLAPERNGRRDVYVYGSQLGATLAASLALTENHSHQRMAVRGLAAFNGIYNWTMFLPDHRANQPTTTKSGRLIPAPQLSEGSPLAFYKRQLPALFSEASGLFDPFVSPCLFFHTPGLFVPKSFAYSEAMASMVDSLASASEDGEPAMADPLTPSRKSPLIFPPRSSTLKIPETLLLYDTEAEALQTKSEEDDAQKPTRKQARTAAQRQAKTTAQRTARGSKAKGNSFGLQASELAGLMRRSIEKVELKERRMWDDEFGDWDAEAERRVQVANCGLTDGSMELSTSGEELLGQWLRDRISR